MKVVWPNHSRSEKLRMVVGSDLCGHAVINLKIKPSISRGTSNRCKKVKNAYFIFAPV